MIFVFMKFCDRMYKIFYLLILIVCIQSRLTVRRMYEEKIQVDMRAFGNGGFD